MANTSDRIHDKLQREQKALTEEEAKRMNIGLRGGRNVEQEEEERGLQGSRPERSGTAGGRSARGIRAEQEQASEETNTEGRSGGRSHH